MSGVECGILKAGIDIGLFQVRKILKDFLRLHPTSEHFQDLAGGNPHAPNGRLTATEVRYNRDSIKIHKCIL